MTSFFFLQIQLILNTIQSTSPAAEELVKHDPYGLFLAIVAITIVITVLSFIYLVFKLLSKLSLSFNKENKSKQITINSDENLRRTLPTGEICAAIAMALYQYKKETEADDSSMITIKKITHRYSPWNSKIYGLMNNPHNKTNIS
jgi:Na+-transporting methylmalonyl-CoA/oxaloacetate decarboxylase gamma subunit